MINRLFESLVGLAGLSGYVDAASYFRLGHAFPANMTGNTVLLCLATVHFESAHVMSRGAVLFSFLVGAMVASRLLRGARAPRTLRRRDACLWLEFFILVAFALGGWLIPQGRLERGGLYGLVAMAAFAMGIQATRVGALGRRGVSTTYITGTYIAFVAGWRRRVLRSSRRLFGAVLIAYIAGCVLGGMAEASFGGRCFAAAPVALAAILFLSAPDKPSSNDFAMQAD